MRRMGTGIDTADRMFQSVLVGRHVVDALRVPLWEELVLVRGEDEDA